MPIKNKQADIYFKPMRNSASFCRDLGSIELASSLPLLFLRDLYFCRVLQTVASIS